jgi:uridine phosphorylase
MSFSRQRNFGGADRPSRTVALFRRDRPRTSRRRHQLSLPAAQRAAAIERARDRDILAVEMEAAALYAFAQARHKPVLCLAHVTNQMAIETGDFEKGEAAGAQASLAVVAAVAGACLNRR